MSRTAREEDRGTDRLSQATTDGPSALRVVALAGLHLHRRALHVDLDLAPAALRALGLVADQVAVAQRHRDRLRGLLDAAAAERVVLEALQDLGPPAGLVGEV